MLLSHCKVSMLAVVPCVVTEVSFRHSLPHREQRISKGTEPRRLISELSTSLKEVETSMSWGSAKGRFAHTADATRVLLIRQRSMIIVN